MPRLWYFPEMESTQWPRPPSLAPSGQFTLRSPEPMVSDFLSSTQCYLLLTGAGRAYDMPFLSRYRWRSTDRPKGCIKTKSKPRASGFDLERGRKGAHVMFRASGKWS